MNDYIDRAALKKRFQKRLIWLEKDVHNEYSKGLFHGCETDMSLIDEIPAADVVEVRHGRWIFKEYDEMPWCTQAICSECGAVVENNSSLTTESGEKYFLKDNQYCRKCGALMDKEDDHEVG